MANHWKYSTGRGPCSVLQCSPGASYMSYGRHRHLSNLTLEFLRVMEFLRAGGWLLPGAWCSQRPYCKWTSQACWPHLCFESTASAPKTLLSRFMHLSRLESHRVIALETTSAAKNVAKKVASLQDPAVVSYPNFLRHPLALLFGLLIGCESESPL